MHVGPATIRPLSPRQPLPVLVGGASGLLLQ